MRLILLFISVSLFFSCQKDITERKIANIVERGRLNDPVIEDYLLTSKSINEFLSKVKSDSTTNHYLRNFVPIWRSDSLQQSFWFCPRVLMYNQDASFIFSIIDCPYYTSERDDVEIVQWSKEKNRYELYSVHFRLNGKNVVDTFDYYRKKNKEISLGEENPSECLRCHRGGIAIGAYDPFFFGDDYPDYWMENMEFLRDKVGKNGYFQKKNGYRIQIPRYGDYFDLAGLTSDFPTLAQYRNDELARYDQPIHKFNTILAQRNHKRTVQVMKDEAIRRLGKDGWNKVKYSTLAAISGCGNYGKMARQDNKLFPPHTMDEIVNKIQTSGKASLTASERQAEANFFGGLKNFSSGERAEQEEHTDLDIGILKRIGYNRLFTDMMDTKDKYEKVNKNRQMYGIAKFYHSWYTYWTDQSNMRQAVLQVNLNTIKFAMHPAWGVANLAHHLIQEDNDLKAFEMIGDFSTRDFLNIMSGIKHYEVFNKNDSVKSKRKIHYKKDKEEFNQIMYSGGLKNTPDHPDFTKYCKAIENKYNSTK